MKLTEKEQNRLVLVMIYRTIPSFESDREIDESLESKGLVTMSKHGATITELGATEIQKVAKFPS
jgi:ribosomal protein S19E (S16A)